MATESEKRQARRERARQGRGVVLKNLELEDEEAARAVYEVPPGHSLLAVIRDDINLACREWRKEQADQRLRPSARAKVRTGLLAREGMPEPSEEQDALAIIFDEHDEPKPEEPIEAPAKPVDTRYRE